ncbi:MAG: TonB-dependent receptor, partial [Chitinophagaceae bacterium]
MQRPIEQKETIRKTQDTIKPVSKTQLSDSIGRLDEVVITANRFPQKQNQTGKVLTVITKEMLEKNSGRSTAEILNQFAGMNLVGANNTPGTNIEIYTRGSNVGNTLILVDGIPIFDVSSITSAFDINHYTTDQLERIEILKGAQSSVYGSDAVAGVINLITQKKDLHPLQANVNLSFGSFGTWNGNVGIQSSSKKNQFYIQYQKLYSKGLSSAIDTLGQSGFDRDAFNQNVVSGSFQHKFNSNLTWLINTQMSSYHADIDANAFNDDKDNRVYSRNNLISTGILYKKGNSEWHINYAFDETNRRYEDDSTSVGGYFKYGLSDYKGLSHFAEVYGNIHLNEQWNIVTGLDSRIQKTAQHFLFIDDWGTYESGLGKDTTKINMQS